MRRVAGESCKEGNEGVESCRFHAAGQRKPRPLSAQTEQTTLNILHLGRLGPAAFGKSVVCNYSHKQYGLAMISAIQDKFGAFLLL